MTDRSPLQVIRSGPVSPEAAMLAADVIGEGLGLDEALRRTVDHFLAAPRVQIVTVALTSFTPSDPTHWTRLGGRAWVREFTPAGSTWTLLPPPGAGAEAALSMPWLSQRGREGVVVLRERDRLPPEAQQDRDELVRAGVRGLVAATFTSRDEMFGSLSLVGDEEGDWPEQLIDDFRLLNAALTARLALERSRRALAEAVDASAQAQEGYQQFYAAVGHELRTPLGAIMGYTEVLLDDAAHAPDEQMAAALLRDGPVILRAGEQLLAVVDNLLGAGRALASGDARESVGVADALADVVHWHRAPALAAHVEMTVDVDPDMAVWAHPSGVRQVLANLVGNAISHHRPGGGSVHLSAELLRGESGQPMVRIVVRDDGPGLEPDQLARAFDPFVRFAPRGAKGTGLGLSISRTIAERDGGAVRGVSTVGAGSSFWLELPARPTVPPPSHAT